MITRALYIGIKRLARKKNRLSKCRKTPPAVAISKSIYVNFSRIKDAVTKMVDRLAQPLPPK